MSKLREDNRKAIQTVLGFTDQEYGEMVMNYAYRYLEIYLNGDQEAIRMLTLSSFFWEWWRNQWDLRNAKFVYTWYLSLHNGMDKKGREILRSLYLESHVITPQDARPHPEVVRLISEELKMDDLYEDMIRYVIKNETNQNQNTDGQGEN